jgi:hypothetical protein
MVYSYSLFDWGLVAVAAIGSTPIGYFVLRMAYPEVRVFDPSIKAGYSMIVGVLLVLFGLFVDLFLVTPLANTVGGMLPLTILITIIAAFIVLRVLAMLELPKSIELGLPIRHYQSGNQQTTNYGQRASNGGAVHALGSGMLTMMNAMNGATKEHEINTESKN